MPRRYAKKDNTKDYYGSWIKLLRSKWWLVVLFLLITAIVLISQLFDASRSIYSNVANGKKSDQPLLDISPVNSKMDKIDSQSLFSQPYIFYFDSTHQHFTRNEIVDEINLANDDISLTASIAPQECESRKFVLVNQPLVDGGILHKIIPLPGDLYSLNEELNYRGEIFTYAEDTTTENIREDNEREDDTDTIHSIDEAGNDPCFINSTGDFLDKYKGSNPSLAIKINNNSAESILIESVECIVKRSAFNPYPILAAEPGTGFDMSVKNYGWRPATDLDFYFNIQQMKDKIRYDTTFQYHLHKNVLKPRSNWEFEDSYPGALRPFFKKEQVDVTKLEKYNFDLPDGKSGDIFFGRYKERMARIVGVVYYDGILASGKVYRDTLHFNFIENLQAPGIGGGTDIERHTPYNIHLSVNRSGYRRKYDVTERISPRSSAVFKLMFYSGKNSYHYFDVVLHYNGNKTMRLDNMFLNEFLQHRDSTFHIATKTHSLKVR